MIERVQVKQAAEGRGGDVGTLQNLYGRVAMSRKLNSARYSVVVGFLTTALLVWHAALNDWNRILCEKYSSLVRN